LCFLLYKSLNCSKVGCCLFVLKCGAFFANRSAVSFDLLANKGTTFLFTQRFRRSLLKFVGKLIGHIWIYRIRNKGINWEV
jgi:uncharacterized protein with WD repeat